VLSSRTPGSFLCPGDPALFTQGPAWGRGSRPPQARSPSRRTCLSAGAHPAILFNRHPLDAHWPSCFVLNPCAGSSRASFHSAALVLCRMAPRRTTENLRPLLGLRPGVMDLTHFPRSACGAELTCGVWCLYDII